jgi:hypothetical protein
VLQPPEVVQALKTAAALRRRQILVPERVLHRPLAVVVRIVALNRRVEEEEEEERRNTGRTPQLAAVEAAVAGQRRRAPLEAVEWRELPNNTDRRATGRKTLEGGVKRTGDET